jgi:catechol-2,3-dioxygenase
MDIAEVRLQTHQLTTLYDFYAKTCGLEVVDHTPDAFTLVTGSSTVIFEQTSENNVVPQYHIAWNIPENQFQEAKAWANERAELLVIPEAKFEETKGFTRKPSEEDVEHYEIYFVPWNADATYFCDPVGNILEFIARHDLKNASDEPFGHRSFLSISEIGMVVDDVIATTKLVCDTLGTTVYSKIDDIFAAIGDINGLFIIVKKGHQWFPTMRDALVFPTQVKVRGKQFSPFNLPDAPHMICDLA